MPACLPEQLCSSGVGSCPHSSSSSARGLREQTANRRELLGRGEVDADAIAISSAVRSPGPHQRERLERLRGRAQVGDELGLPGLLDDRAVANGDRMDHVRASITSPPAHADGDRSHRGQTTSASLGKELAAVRALRGRRTQPRRRSPHGPLDRLADRRAASHWSCSSAHSPPWHLRGLAAAVAPQGRCKNRTNNTYDKLLGCVTLEGVRATSGPPGDRGCERRPLLPAPRGPRVTRTASTTWPSRWRTPAGGHARRVDRSSSPSRAVSGS